MFKRIFQLTWLMALCFQGFAQSITIKDQENFEPLEMVAIGDRSTGKSVTSDASGKADISVFIRATALEIRLVGYLSQVLSFDQIRAEEFIIYLQPSDLSMDAVVVAASRWQENWRNVPSKISSITSKNVALQNPQTVADLLGTSGSVFIQKSQMGGGSPMIRGFATNRLLIAVDGIRMNTAIFRSGNLQNVISLDPQSIEHTEVLFGPGSVMYGSDAIAGVMSFYTLKPKLSTTGEPEVKGSAFSRLSSASNERTVHFDVNVGLKKWASLTSFSHNHFGDLRMGANGPEEYLRLNYVVRMDSVDRVVTNDDPLVQRPTGYEQINLMQKVRFSPTKKWDLDYAIHYSTTTDVSRYDRLLRLRNDLPRSAEWYYGPQVWLMNMLGITHHSPGGLYDQMSLRFAQQHFEESRIDRDLNDSERRIREEEVEAYSFNADFEKKVAEKHQVYYGAEAVQNDVTSSGTDKNIVLDSTYAGPARYPNSTWSSYAAYATYQYRPSKKMNIQAGARYNLYQLDAEFDTTFYPLPFTTAEINSGSVTGSLGLAYSPKENLTLRINLSTGFRSPNVDDVGKVFDSEPGAVVIPNPDLSSENVGSAELGITKAFGNVLKLDVAAYYTMLDNALVRRNFTLNGEDSVMYAGELSQVQAVQNAAEARVMGLEAGVDIYLSHGLGISSRFNFQKGEEELDDGTIDPLRHAAPWFGSTHLTYSARKLRLDLYALYNGEVSFENLAAEERSKDYIYAINDGGNPYSPSWLTLNFKALYTINENFSVSGGVENLLDERYRPYSSGIVASGRNVILAARASF